FLYFFFFSSFDFGSLFKSNPTVMTQKDSALMALEKDNLPGFRVWMQEFYYDVSDAKVLDPNADNSGNGLTNFQKYLLNLNPKSYDTLGLGMADSEALAAGINPLTGNKLTDSQKSVIDAYFDMEVISNRLALNHLQSNGNVAGARTGNDFSFGALSAQASEQPEFRPSVDFLGGSGLEIDTAIPGRLE